jgi:hypothetical protein
MTASCINAVTAASRSGSIATLEMAGGGGAAAAVRAATRSPSSTATRRFSVHNSHDAHASTAIAATVAAGAAACAPTREPRPRPRRRAAGVGAVGAKGFAEGAAGFPVAAPVVTPAGLGLPPPPRPPRFPRLRRLPPRPVGAAAPAVDALLLLVSVFMMSRVGWGLRAAQGMSLL